MPWGIFVLSGQQNDTQFGCLDSGYHSAVSKLCDFWQVTYITKTYLSDRSGGT